jgi:hypothetical protein
MENMLINREDNVPSNSNTDLEPVASHSCTFGNSNQQSKITSKNCLQRTKEEIIYVDGAGGQAAAWVVVYDFLCENGLYDYYVGDRGLNKSGIEIVIMFLESLLNKEQGAKECDATESDSSNAR